MRHQATEAHEREAEAIREDEVVTEEIYDTVTTIQGGDTTTTMRHGVRERHRATEHQRIRAKEQELTADGRDTLMAKETQGRVRDCREEDAGLARYVLGAMIALLLLLTITITITKKR